MLKNVVQGDRLIIIVVICNFFFVFGHGFLQPKDRVKVIVAIVRLSSQFEAVVRWS